MKCYKTVDIFICLKIIYEINFVFNLKPKNEIKSRVIKYLTDRSGKYLPQRFECA